MAVLDTIEEDGCQEISNQMGTHLLRGLANLRSEFEVRRLCLPLSTKYYDPHLFTYFYVKTTYFLDYWRC